MVDDIDLPITEPEVSTLSVEDIVARLEISRVRRFLPDTSAYVRYAPYFDAEAYDEETGRFTLTELVNELEFAYILVHAFPSEEAMNYFLAGFNSGLSQLEFIGGEYDFSRLWITHGVSNLGLPVAIFLGQRSAVNGQPSVALIDHRASPGGERAYRAVRGAGAHVGETFLTT